MTVTKPELSELMEPLTALAREAGQKILEIYNTEDVDVQQKEDKSPLTAADMAAHNAIIAGLHRGWFRHRARSACS